MTSAYGSIKFRIEILPTILAIKSKLQRSARYILKLETQC